MTAKEPDAHHRGRAEAAKAAWTASRVHQDGARQVASTRRRALIRGWAGVAIGALLFFLGHPIVGAIAAVLGQVHVLLALARAHAVLARLDALVAQTGEWVGRALAWLFLAPLHLLVLTPYGRLARRGHRDPLERGADASAATYWRARDESKRAIDEAAIRKPY